MNVVLRPLYNLGTWAWHKILRAPIRMHVAYDNRIKHPELTVVFLHGISATAGTWQATVKQFSKDPELKTVRMISLDLLGFGRSLQADWLDYDYDDYNSALNRTFKHLHIKSPVVLVGHSMGSLIAANYATNYQPYVDLTRLVLVSPPVLLAAELSRLPDRVYTKSYGALHNFAVEVPAAEVIAKIIQKFSSFRSDYLKTAAFGKSMEQVILNRKNYQTFTKINIPTLLLHGHFDPLVMGSNLRRVAKQNPRVRYQSVIGHHDISIGKRAKIISEVKRSLREVRNAAKTETI